MLFKKTEELRHAVWHERECWRTKSLLLDKLNIRMPLPLTRLCMYRVGRAGRGRKQRGIWMKPKGSKMIL